MINLNTYNNSWYHPGKSFFKRGLWYLCNVLFIHGRLLPFSSLRIRLLRSFGAQIGKGVVIRPGTNIKYPWHLTIGNNTWIGEGVWIDNLTNVTIGNNVCISQGAMLLCGNHNYTSPHFDLIVSPISLGDGVWIGAKALVAPGVNAEEGAVLCAQSVATTALQAFCIYQGNPAIYKKKRMIHPQL